MMVQVTALIVLGVCFCYAMKVCCFTLTVAPEHVGGVDVKQSRPRSASQLWTVAC